MFHLSVFLLCVLLSCKFLLGMLLPCMLLASMLIVLMLIRHISLLSYGPAPLLRVLLPYLGMSCQLFGASEQPFRIKSRGKVKILVQTGSRRCVCVGAREKLVQCTLVQKLGEFPGHLIATILTPYIPRMFVFFL